MKRALLVSILMSVCALPLFAQEVQVAEHWSPYTYPTSFPEGARVHLIVKGDTLWDLAQKFYNNPLVWPKIHAANPYITDPHWIYPDDPLVLPDLKVVEPGRVTGEERAELDPDAAGAEGQPGDETGDAAEESGQQERAGEPMPFDSQTVIFETEPRPSTEYEAAARDLDLYCSAVVYPQDISKAYYVAGREENEQIEIGVYDVVYINRGREYLSPGDLMIASNFARKVYHPHTKEFVGYAYQEVGLVRILIAAREHSVAEIIYGCDGLKVGSVLIPFEKRPNPVDRIRRVMTVYEKYQELVPKAMGVLVYHNYDSMEAATDDVTVVNLGATHNLSVGTKLLLLKENSLKEMYPNWKFDPSDPNDWLRVNNQFDGTPTRTDMPSLIARVGAEAIVIRTTETTATIKISYSYNAFQVGDFVVLIDTSEMAD